MVKGGIVLSKSNNNTILLIKKYLKNTIQMLEDVATDKNSCEKRSIDLEYKI